MVDGQFNEPVAESAVRAAREALAGLLESGGGDGAEELYQALEAAAGTWEDGDGE